MINTDFTFLSASRTSKAALTVSAFAPPPISKKFAAFPPFSATTSRVDITKPAPFPIIPTDPSSFMKFRPFSFAFFSDSGIGISFSKSSKYECLYFAFMSSATFESRAITPASVIANGFTSTRSQSPLTNIKNRFCIISVILFVYS